MAFESLSEKLNETFKRLRGKGRLTEADVKEGMREVRLALLEADVSYKVVKDFVAKVTERAIGSDVLDSLTPAQQVIKIVNEELIALMGSETSKLASAPHPPTVVMMVGLNGAGKTTTTAKLRRPHAPPVRQASPAGRLRRLPSRRHRAAEGGGRPAGPSRSLRRARATPSRSPGTPSATPGTTATTSSSWIPPAASMWTRSSWTSSSA